MKKPEIIDIVEIVNTCTKDVKISELDAEKSFIELGIDSIDFISVIVKLEEMYEFEFPDEKLIMSELDSVLKILFAIDEIKKIEE